MMKRLLLVILLTAAPLFAVDPPFVYEGEIAGVYCSACASHVKAALMKIDGVQEVKIKIASQEGKLPRLILTAKNDHITREQAVKALGKEATSYDIRSLSLAKSSAPQTSQP